MSIGAGTTSSALAKLSLNDGTLILRGNSGYGAGGATLTTTTGFSNAGNLQVDQSGSDGGSTLTFGGSLTNANQATIGNQGLSASTTVTATGLTNTGDLTLQGNTGSGTTNEAALDITGGVSSTLTGTVRVGGDADLEVGSNIKSIGVGSSLELDGAQARVSIGAATTSSALGLLSLNNGTLLLRGGSGSGAGGVALTTTTGFDNVGNLEVDSYGGDGGSTLTIGGVLTNQGYISGSPAQVSIGNAGMNASTTVTATGLISTGDLTLQGNSGSGTTNEAVLDITGGVPSTLTGAVRVSGEADLEVGSRIKSIGVGSSLELDGADARVSIGAGTSSSALSELSLNDGNLVLRGNSGNGAGAVSLKTTTGFTNVGNLSIDPDGGDGGSNVTIGGMLTNQGYGTSNQAQIVIGSAGLSAATTVTAAGLENDGVLTLSGTGTAPTNLIVNGNATNNGDINVNANATLYGPPVSTRSRRIPARRSSTAPSRRPRSTPTAA
ncbi:MAG TPA: hypothetical protein VJY39_10840 [Acidisphaera sp.]|nr:hypothetical protein [Acidisphaera sp.]